jgi:hypothetical protein
MTIFNCTNGSIVTSVTTTKVSRIRLAAEKLVSPKLINFFCVDDVWLVDVNDTKLSVEQKAALVEGIHNATN